MDQVDQLILQVKGEEELKRLNAELEKERQALTTLATAQNQNVQATQAQAQKVIDLTEKVKDLQGQTGKGGRGIMGLSYAFQDFTSVIGTGGSVQQALFSISNNIDALGTAMGLSAKAAGTLSLGFSGFVTALPVLIPLFKQMWESIRGGPDGPDFALQGIDMAKEKVKELEGRVKDLLKAMRPEEVETKKQVEALITERGAARIIGATQAALAAEAPITAPADQPEEDRFRREWAEAIQRPPSAARSARLDELKRSYDAFKLASRGRSAAEAQRRAQQIVTDLGVDPLARNRLQGLMKRFPGMFSGLEGLPQELEYAGGGYIAAESAGVEQARQFHEAREERHKQNRIGERLTAEGKQIEDEDRDSRQKAGEKERERQKVIANITAVTRRMGYGVPTPEQALAIEHLARPLVDELGPERARERAATAEVRRIRAAGQQERQFRERERYMRPLRGDVSRASMEFGAGRPTAAQAEEVAGNALAMMQQGAGRQEAVWMSVMQKVQAIYQQMMFQQALQSRMQAGTDQSGSFSYLAPFSPF